jgi:hypothetical protein
MSKEAVELAIGKALLNAGFRELLFAQPEQALSGFNLTAVEKNSLKRVDSETLELLAQTLHARLHGTAHKIPAILLESPRFSHPQNKVPSHLANKENEK